MLTTSGGSRYKAKRETRLRYCCHNKIRHPQNCDGQSGYSAEKLDGIVEKLIVAMFRSIKSVSEQELMSSQLEQRMAEQRTALSRLQTQKAQKEKELESYKSEVYKAIRGESTWDQGLLNELILDTKSALTEIEAQLNTAQSAIAESNKVAAELRTQYDKVLTWADLFEGSSMEGKKMIVWQLIDKVRIFRNYKIEIDLKVSFAQFKTLWHREDKKVTIAVAA